jgi:ParB family chromosome partitioning protein
MTDIIIAKVDKARMLLAECRDAPEAKRIVDMAHAAEIYAKRQKLSEESIAYAHAVKIDAQTMLGEFLARQPKNKGASGSKPAPGKLTGTKREPVMDATPTLASVGISKKESAEAQKLARIKVENPERHAAMRAGSDAGHNHRAQGTGDNEWFTPAEYIEAARAFMGGIDLDPASHPLAQKTVRARKFFTKEQDGLKQKWAGRVWLNPPYAQPEIEYFCDKMVAEVKSGNVEEAVMLTHNYTDTAWFHKLESEACSICFTRGRIRFVNLIRGEVSTPTQGQAFFYFGMRRKEFTAAFKQFGFVR